MSGKRLEAVGHEHNGLHGNKPGLRSSSKTITLKLRGPDAPGADALWKGYVFRSAKKTKRASKSLAQAEDLETGLCRGVDL